VLFLIKTKYSYKINQKFLHLARHSYRGCFAGFWGHYPMFPVFVQRQNPGVGVSVGYWPQKLHQAVGVIDELGDTFTRLSLEIKGFGGHSFR
jgi:hypothetical protein